VANLRHGEKHLTAEDAEKCRGAQRFGKKIDGINHRGTETQRRIFYRGLGAGVAITDKHGF
jgi:hypothetical protein